MFSELVGGTSQQWSKEHESVQYKVTALHFYFFFTHKLSLWCIVFPFSHPLTSASLKMFEAFFSPKNSTAYSYLSAMEVELYDVVKLINYETNSISAVQQIYRRQ